MSPVVVMLPLVLESRVVPAVSVAWPPTVVIASLIASEVLAVRVMLAAPVATMPPAASATKINPPLAVTLTACVTASILLTVTACASSKV